MNCTILTCTASRDDALLRAQHRPGHQHNRVLKNVHYAPVSTERWEDLYTLPNLLLEGCCVLRRETMLDPLSSIINEIVNSVATAIQEGVIVGEEQHCFIRHPSDVHIVFSLDIERQQLLVKLYF